MKYLKDFSQYSIKESLIEFENDDTSKWIAILESHDIDTMETRTKRSRKVVKYKREDGNVLELQPNGKWKSSKSGNEYSQKAIDNLVNNHELNVVNWEPMYENTSKSNPKFKVGDRLVYMDENPDFTFPLDDDMVVSSEPFWKSNENHPNGGYWAYPIEGKANPCPEDFLTPYVEGQEEYTDELPCHVYYKSRKAKNK